MALLLLLLLLLLSCGLGSLMPSAAPIILFAALVSRTGLNSFCKSLPADKVNEHSAGISK
jgi:hypothetical protein